MHLEFLVEDKSGKKLLDIIIPKILAGYEAKVTEKYITAHSGLGAIPDDLHCVKAAASKRLLNKLPAFLRGFAKTYSASQGAVIVVADLDDEDMSSFTGELDCVLKQCGEPNTVFAIAVEEMESWILGDKKAIKTAYKNTNLPKLKAYEQDSICGTWECLADAIYRGGSVKLKPKGYPRIGIVKCEWAEKIGPHMNVENNKSPSFQRFRDDVRALLA